MKNLSLAIGGDHAGFLMKQHIIEFLRGEGYEVKDCGSFNRNPIDFPDIAIDVCSQVLEEKAQRGILVCGTGVGACIAANKIPRIRASVCHDIYTAHQCVEHDDVNVMCIGAQIIGSKVAEDCLRAFLSAKFSGEAHFRRRIDKLSKLERSTIAGARSDGDTDRRR